MVLCLSVCLSISSSAFLLGMGCSFFSDFCTMVDNWNCQKISEPFFPGKFIFPQTLGNIAQNDPKICYLDFLNQFVVNFPGII